MHHQLRNAVPRLGGKNAVTGARRFMTVEKEMTKEAQFLRIEQKRLLAKAYDIVKGKAKPQASMAGALRVGKEVCDHFQIPHPQLQTEIEYKKLLTLQLPKLSIVEEETSLPTASFWESEFSCFRRTDRLVKENAKLAKQYKNYLVIDFETTTHSALKRKASPFVPQNRIVYTAHLNKDQKKGVVDGPFSTPTAYRKAFPSLKGIDCIIGHNVKFDLLYCWDHAELKNFFRRGGLVWDTMYAEYVINGHKDMKLSLDDLSLKYGGELKDAYIKEQWAKGIDTPDIKKSKIVEYAAADVENTRLIFERQLAFTEASVRLPLMHSHMEGLLATTEMEYNGMYVNRRRALLIGKDLTDSIDVLEKELSTSVPKEIADLNNDLKSQLKNPEDIVEFNWASATQLRAYLFGGDVVYKRSTMCDERKKHFMHNFKIEFPGIIPEEWKLQYAEKYKTKGEAWKVSDDVISNISEKYPDEEFASPVRVLQALKKKKKLMTYLQGFVDLRDDGGRVHPQLNHTVTRTGRLSSANPNMQNIPRTGVKECLESRFKDGLMLESDYSQLEVFVNALLSQDENLMHVLEEGADLHCKRLAAMKGMSYDEVVHLCKVKKDPFWTGLRTQAKVFSFQRQYGASIKTIAAETKMSYDEVQKLADTEDAMYPDVAKYFARVTKALVDTASQSHGTEGFYDSPSGNRWYFEGERSNRLKGMAAPLRFRRQLVLNHPVQGFAAELVLTCLGRLWRHFMNNGNFSESGDFTTPPRALMVNTVHDCVWIDTQRQVADEVAVVVDRILCDVQGPYTEKGYNLDSWVNFKSETHMGTTMADV